MAAEQQPESAEKYWLELQSLPPEAKRWLMDRLLHRMVEVRARVELIRDAPEEINTARARAEVIRQAAKEWQQEIQRLFGVKGAGGKKLSDTTLSIKEDVDD